LGTANLSTVAQAFEAFFKIRYWNKQMPIDWVKISIYFYFSHMCFIEKTDCKLFVSIRSVNAISTYKSIFLLAVR